MKPCSVNPLVVPLNTNEVQKIGNYTDFKTLSKMTIWNSECHLEDSNMLV